MSDWFETFNNALPAVNIQVPGAPTGVIASLAAGGAISVSLTPPLDNGGALITGYQVFLFPGNIPSSISTSTTIVVGGTTLGTTYTAIAYAINGKGASLPSAQSNAVLAMTAPAAPTNVVATAANSRATVTFTPSASNGGSPITGYLATASPTGQTATGDAAGDPITILGLTPGVNITISVQALNAAAPSVASVASNVVTPVVSTKPDAPIIGTLTVIGTTLSCTFTPPANDGGSAINQYEINYVLNGVPRGGAGTATSSPAILSNVANGTYTVNINAANSNGIGPPSAASNAVIVTGIAIGTAAIVELSDVASGAGSATSGAGAPGQVTKLQVLFIGMSAAGQGSSGGAPVPTNGNTQSIGWTQATAGAFPITQNRIYRGLNGVAPTLYQTIAAATSYVDTAATNCIGSVPTPHNAANQTWPANGYKYQVSAVDSQGTEGPKSTTQIFYLYNGGPEGAQGHGFQSNVNLGLSANYSDNTGAPPAGGLSILNTVTSSFADWLQNIGNNAPFWNLWCGTGSTAQVYAFLNISIKPSVANQTFNMWIEYRTDGNTDPVGGQAGITGVGNSAALYGPQMQANVWATYKLPLSLLMLGAPAEAGIVEGMFYKLGMADQTGLSANHYWISNVYLTPT